MFKLKKKTVVIVMAICLFFIFNSGISGADTIGDVNNDGKIDLIEAIHALEVTSGVRKQSINVINNTKDIALVSKGAVATASSVGSYSGYIANPTEAIDGKIGKTFYGNDGEYNFWGGTSTPAWIKVELPEIERVYEIELFSHQHTQTINIEVSTDGTDWITVVPSTIVNTHGDEFRYSDSRNRFELQPTRRAKYIRVNITSTDAPSSHIYQAIISEIKVYAY